MTVAALAAMSAALNVLFSVVPCAAGIGHHNRQHKTCNRCSRQQTCHTCDAQNQTDDNGCCNRNQRRGHHQLLRTLGTHIHTGSIIRICFAFHQALNLMELTAHLYYNALRRLAHCIHGQRRKQERKHSAHKQANQHGGIGNAQIHLQVGVNLVHFVDVACNQSQSRNCRRTDREAFARGSRGVTQAVQSVCAAAHLRRHVRHFRDTACIVRNGAVCIRGQSDAQRAQHANR